MREAFILLPMMVCLVWLAILTMDALLGRVGRDRKVLTAYALVVTLLYFCHACHFLHPQDGFSWVDALYAFCTLACYMVYLLYIKALTDREGLRWPDVLWLLPALLVFLYALGVLVLGGSYKPVQMLVRLITPVEILLLLYLGLRRLRAFDRQVEDYYSDPENHSSRRIRNLIWTMLVLALFAFAANVIGRDFFQTASWILVPSLLFSTMQFMVLYVGNRQQSTAEEMAEDEQEVAATASVGTAPASDELGESIRKLMESKEMYRQKGLRITDVAAAVGSNRTYVSQWFNLEAGQSFSEYINAWRVEYAKKALLKGSDSPSMSVIAEEAGFSSESSFFRNFRLLTGTTPLAWLQANKR